MAEDRPEEVGSLPDPSRPKREPPTIDLEATDVSGEPVKANAEAQPESEPEVGTEAGGGGRGTELRAGT